jgi:hypothetical protein
MLGPSLLQIRQTDSNQNSIKHDSLRIQHCWVLLQVLIDNFPTLHQSFLEHGDISPVHHKFLEFPAQVC